MADKDLTIRDIARIAGVSKSTVSRVINKQYGVNEKTRIKVEKAIIEYSYTPNNTARELSSSRSDSIGIFIGDISNQYYQEILRGAESVISHSSFFPIICLTASPRRQALYIEELKQRRIRGMIFASSYIYDNESMSALLNSTTAVSVQTDLPGIPKTDIDNFAASYDIAKYLIDKGHREMGYIDSYNQIDTLKKRLEGFQKALSDHGIPVSSLHYVVSDENYHGYDPVMDLLKNKNITAIHCSNDHLTMDAYSAIRDSGLTIPSDISLTGFDDLPIDRLLIPKLTRIHQPLYEMGQTAAEKLIRMIENGAPEQDTILPYSFINGDSVISI